MGLKIIGAGFGRTGTDSMRAALTILGLGPCHHMFEVNAKPEERDTWRAVAAGAAPDWDRLLEGYRSAVDWPTVHYWRELMEVYPDAKVLLTWRTPESWWASIEKTILPMMEKIEPESLGRRLILEQTFGGDMSRENAQAVYRKNVEAALSEVPPGRLIVHRLGDGWGPLCAGLGLPVPDMPYPSGNSSVEFRTRQGIGT